jgi:parvulin-like peptidyl-prolyl isomerase
MQNPHNKPKIATKKHIARLERERRQVNLIRWISIGAISLVVLMIGFGTFNENYLKLRKPAAEVNGEVITVGYWRERVQLQRMNLLNNLQYYQFLQQNFGFDTSQQQQQIYFQLQAEEYFGEQVLNRLVDEALIRQEAERRGITVTEPELEERIRAAYDYYPNGSPTPTITPTSFEYPTLTNEQLAIYAPTATATATPTPTATPTNTADPSLVATFTATATATEAPATVTPIPELPTSTNTPYTLEGFREQYEKSIEGIRDYKVSEETYRSAYRNQIYYEKLFAEITKETARVEEQVLARHILVETEAEATAISELLASGVDFAKLAKEYSSDPGSAVLGGNLEWFGRGVMVAEFEEASFTQEIGVIGDPVKTQFGYHFIQVVTRQERPLSSTDYEQKQQTVFNDWLTQFREDAQTAGGIITYDHWKNSLPPLNLQ